MKTATLMNLLDATEYVYWKLFFSVFIFAISGAPWNFGVLLILHSTEQFYFFPCSIKSQQPFPQSEDKVLHFLGCTGSRILHLRWVKSCYGTNLLCLFILKVFSVSQVCVYVHTHIYKYIHTYMCKTASRMIVQCGVQVKHCLKVICFSSRILLDFSVYIYSFATPEKFLFFWL